MLCPNPECESHQTGEQLPDNYEGSFCDICGKDLFRCVNPDCEANGKLTINHQKCTSCGEDVEPNAPAGGAPQMAQPAAVQPAMQAPPAQAAAQNHAATEMMPVSGGGRIFLRHGEGWTLELADGDILGRVNGNHAGRLGNSKVISGTHAQVTRSQNGWCIADQKSLNKTYVNGQALEPFAPVPIKQNDVVTLADMKFIVVVI